MTAHRTCSYCARAKPETEFSYEHIWPDALGGDHLPPLWQTHNVCIRCNSLAGQFVDAEFIKSWFGSHERSRAAREYLDPTDPTRIVPPLTYMGPLTHDELREDEVAEFWLGPCGSHNIHIRPKHEPTWDTYAGGKPTRRRAEWGSAFLALTSEHPYWVVASIEAFQKHFRLAERIATNCNAPPGFAEIDPQNIEQARKLRIARHVGEAAKRGERVNSQFTINLDTGSRLLAKIALGLGRELLGEDFLATEYAGALRQGLQARDYEARQKSGVRGSGYMSEATGDPALEKMVWPGAWLLMLTRNEHGLTFVVITPSRKMMSVLISDNPVLLASLGDRFAEAEVYLTIPAIGRAVGPIGLPDYLAHQLEAQSHPDLTVLGALRGSSASLPPCR